MTRNSISLVLLTGSSLLIWIIACNRSKAGNDVLTFYYYPQKNVYFDPSAHKYFYSMDGAKTWDSLFAKTENAAALGPRIILSSSAKEIWRSNQAHRKQYNANLINIQPGDTSLLSSIASAPKKKVVVPKKEEKKRGFFQRLFGKKKKSE